VAIDGARNAGLLAVQIVATGDPALMDRLHDYKEELAAGSREKDRRLQDRVREQAVGSSE
jgi:5-(carboxyamino)imidazole ribonucleotide mutase